jgi:hypothetical protein
MTLAPLAAMTSLLALPGIAARLDCVHGSEESASIRGGQLLNLAQFPRDGSGPYPQPLSMVAEASASLFCTNARTHR